MLKGIGAGPDGAAGTGGGAAGVMKGFLNAVGEVPELADDGALTVGGGGVGAEVSEMRLGDWGEIGGGVAEGCEGVVWRAWKVVPPDFGAGARFLNEVSWAAASGPTARTRPIPVSSNGLRMSSGTSTVFCARRR